jgi:hypothetical protein
VVWEQQVDGIPVFEGVFMAHTTKRGELVSLASQFVPEPEKRGKVELGKVCIVLSGRKTNGDGNRHE